MEILAILLTAKEFKKVLICQYFTLLLNGRDPSSKFSIETPTYDSNGNTSGTQIINHYLYVQNNIANIIIPSSIKAYSPQAVIPQHISTIFSSLEVIDISSTF